MFGLYFKIFFIVHVFFMHSEVHAWPWDVIDIIWRISDNSTLRNGTDDIAMITAADFIKEFRLCVQEKYDKHKPEVVDKSLGELGTYSKLCTNPTGFAMCMVKLNDKNLFFTNIQTFSMMFCGEAEPDLRKQSAEASACLEKLDVHLGNCLDGQDSVMSLLDSFSTDIVDDFDENQCGPYSEVMTCFKTNLENCHAEAVPVAEYLESWIGGKCLAKQQILNPFATVEVCDSASIGAPSLLITLFVPMAYYLSA